MDEQQITQSVDEASQIPPSNAPESPTNDFMDNPDIMTYIEARIQEGIKTALQGNAPKASTIKPTEQERRNFEKMTYRERLNLFNSDPHTYNKLTKGAV